MTLDLTKPLRTVGGHNPVRVHATDLGGGYPILVTVERLGEWESIRLTADGRLSKERHLDGKPYIENIPEECVFEGWVNVYENGGFEFHESRAEADEAAASGRTECIHIRWKYEPGEGLEEA